MPREKRPGRHKSIYVDPDDYPTWMLEEDVNDCLYSIGDDVLSAKALADMLHAAERPSCNELYSAAMKAFAKLNNEKLSIKERSSAGTRAMRKFWEAKVSARRAIMRGKK